MNKPSFEALALGKIRHLPEGLKDLKFLITVTELEEQLVYHSNVTVFKLHSSLDLKVENEPPSEQEREEGVSHVIPVKAVSYTHLTLPTTPYV